MQPIGPLMHEHRDIERIISLLRKEDGALGTGKPPEISRLREMIALMREFADACHHGKEEDILFRELEKKQLSEEHSEIMNGLVEDHKTARKMLAGLEKAINDFEGGNHRAITDMQRQIEKICGLYPRHIDKEDKEFFHPCMDYFSTEERDAMLEEFNAFERNMPHEQYLQRIADLENTGSPLAK